jgi:CheY-like chemotaxis protein
MFSATRTAKFCQMEDKPESAPFPPEPSAQVRGALAHLYDHAFLQNHPLAAMLDRENNLDRVSRAQRVRRLLLDCIERLRPPIDAPADTARAYAILNNRYLDGLPLPTIAEKLGLSERQAYRELEKGVKAITNLLWEQIGYGAASGNTDSRQQIAQQEVERLRPAAHAESIDLADLVSKVSALLKPLSEQTGIRIELAAPDKWPPVIADRTMLRQALLNLLSYALRVVRGSLTLTVTHSNDGGQIDLRESATTSAPVPVRSDDIEQTDIGLAVARSLIEASGGRLEIESGANWRARISFLRARQTTVLAIDDNADIVALFQRYLAGHAVSVVGAESAEEALRLAVEMHPQVITLDVMIPNQDGWEILQKLKTAPETQDIPVIICSVLHEPQLAQAMGASGYVTKPVSQEQLLETLRPWLVPLSQSAGLANRAVVPNHLP